MKVYISVDMEGITGVSLWDETIKGKHDYDRYRVQMTKEALAAVNGALKAGATDIIVKDAHEDGKNLIHDMLPEEVKIISGWSNNPYNMIEGIDDSYDAIIFVGYHSSANSNGNPLAHTLYPERVREVKINGERADEFLIYAYAGMTVNVPVVMVSGDGSLARHVREFNNNITTVATSEGFSGASVHLHPNVSVDKIEDAAFTALSNLSSFKMPVMPNKFTIEVEFTEHDYAYKMSFFPGAELITEHIVRYSARDFRDILVFILFM